MTKSKKPTAESYVQAESDEGFFEEVCAEVEGRQGAYQRLKEWRAMNVPQCSQHPDYQFDRCLFCDVSETVQ